mgnify:CR=1 FL=1
MLNSCFWFGLFSGAGLFTLPLAGRFDRVVGIEVDRRASGNAIESAKRNLIPNVRFETADVGQWVAARRQRVSHPDLVVVDPPRAGLGAQLAARLAGKDLTRLKLFDLELQRFQAEWVANKKTAGLALGHFLGEKESLLVLESDFPKIEEATRALEQLIAEAHKTNPDLKAVSEGMQARRHQVEMEKGGNLPVLFVAGRADMNYTNMRDYQQSTYAFDPFNRNIFAVVFGAKWDLDFGNTKARTQKAEAELEKMQAKQNEAETGIPLKIAIAMWDFEKQKMQMEITQNKYKEANKWSLSEMTAYTTGTGSAKDLIEALGAQLLVEKELAETEYNLCLAAAKLAMEIGDQGTLKSWRE